MLVCRSASAGPVRLVILDTAPGGPIQGEKESLLESINAALKMHTKGLRIGRSRGCHIQAAL